MKQSHQTTAILGAGSWGTGLAIHLASHDRPVRLWEFDKKQTQLMQRDHRNERYMPGIPFPKMIHVVSDLKEVLDSVQDVLIVVPSHVFHQTLITMKPFVNKNTRVAWATKGIDPTTFKLLSELVSEELGERSMAVLSGPSFAKEVAHGQPTAVVVASNDETFASDLIDKFNCGTFRVYTSSDLVGVQLGGAVKNVIALAAGASDGLGYGSNARCGLITRGLAEMMRLGVAMGAQRETFMGLSGLGDLVLTCTDNQSRNRRFGLAMAQGKNRKEVEDEIGQVVEGVYTANQVMHLAKRFNVEMPICEQVWRVLNDEITLQEAVRNLLSRAPTTE